VTPGGNRKENEGRTRRGKARKGKRKDLGHSDQSMRKKDARLGGGEMKKKAKKQVKGHGGRRKKAGLMGSRAGLVATVGGRGGGSTMFEQCAFFTVVKIQKESPNRGHRFRKKGGDTGRCDFEGCIKKGGTRE